MLRLFEGGLLDCSMQARRVSREHNIGFRGGAATDEFPQGGKVLRVGELAAEMGVLVGAFGGIHLVHFLFRINVLI